jgi:hypothetical protein
MKPYKPTIPAGASLFPGEVKAISTVCRLGAEYGYGNLIHHLRNAWSAMLQRKYGFDAEAADMGAGHICVWCRTDSRTGKKVKKGVPKKRKPSPKRP